MPMMADERHSVEHWKNYTDRGDTKYLEKSCPIAALHTRNPLWSVQWSHSIPRVDRPANKSLITKK